LRPFAARPQRRDPRGAPTFNRWRGRFGASAALRCSDTSDAQKT
jgi:hypothetical protein